MSLDIDTIVNGVSSHVLSLGWFDKVTGHEPKSAPGYGLTAAVWTQQIDPLPNASGLAATTGRLVLIVRIYQKFISEPQDAIDPNMLKALDALVAALSGDFELGGNVRNIDLEGQHGIALAATAGYLQQDGGLFRIYDITVPLIINDIWSQSA